MAQATHGIVELHTTGLNITRSGGLPQADNDGVGMLTATMALSTCAIVTGRHTCHAQTPELIGW